MQINGTQRTEEAFAEPLYCRRLTFSDRTEKAVNQSVINNPTALSQLSDGLLREF